MNTVSALMQPWDCIFPNGFLGEVQFKKWTFQQKKWGSIREKKRTFHIPWGSIQKWGCIRADTVV